MVCRGSREHINYTYARACVEGARPSKPTLPCVRQGALVSEHICLCQCHLDADLSSECTARYWEEVCSLLPQMALSAGTKIIKPAGEKLDKLEEAVSQVSLPRDFGAVAYEM